MFPLLFVYFDHTCQGLSFDNWEVNLVRVESNWSNMTGRGFKDMNLM